MKYCTKHLKKFFSVLMIAATLGAVPAKQADAGLLLMPCGVGAFIFIWGLLADDGFLILLDADGNLPQGDLETLLAKKYSFIEDRDVLSSLATAVREKAILAPVSTDGKKLITLSREEVLNILEPTGLADLQPEAVERLIQDLQ